MTDYKLVPIDPTQEMVEAADDAYMPFGDMELALRMAVLAAPAVQGEPVAVADALRQIAGWMDDGGPTYHEAELIGMAISGPVECSSAKQCTKAAKKALLEAAQIWEYMHQSQPAPTPAPSLSPEVLAFAHLMQAKLDQNTHKDGNDKRGWKGCTLPWLFARLLDEVQELQDAIQSGQEIEREAADVGNMAMMIAEVAGGSAANQINREAADD